MAAAEEVDALSAILPASAEVNETPAHEKFRAWAKCYGPGWRGLWRDLPAESFAEVSVNRPGFTGE